jgi:hypothetical protein
MQSFYIAVWHENIDYEEEVETTQHEVTGKSAFSNILANAEYMKETFEKGAGGLSVGLNLARMLDCIT